MSRHSSRTYATPLRLEPAGSRTLWRLLLLLHCLAATAAVAAPLPPAAAFPLYTALAFSLAVCRRRLAPTACTALRNLTWQEGRACTLQLRGGRRVPARLEARAFVHPRLVILYYRTGKGRLRALPLLPDMFDPATWRRLRVRLNTQLCERDETAAL